MKCLLFDLDGTLIDSRQDLSNSVNYALRTINKPERKIDEIVGFIGNGMNVLLRESIGPVEDSLLRQATQAFKSHYKEHFLDKTVPYEGVSMVLPELSKKAKIGIVTNKPHFFAVSILDQLGFGPFIQTIVGGDSLTERKPHPEPLLKALQNLKGNPEQALMIGDGVQDIQAGIHAGFKTCVATYGFGYHPKILKLNPTYRIDRFEDLKEIVS